MAGPNQRVLVLCIGVAMTFGSSTSVSKPETVSERVDAAVRLQMRDQRIPGVSIAVVRNGKIIKAAGYGVANLEVGAPVRVDTIFPAGSITKQFTATAILRLAEEGKIGLDDSITKYFPEAPARWKAITIRHLLTHSSGIPDIFGATEQNLYTKGVIDWHREYTEDELAHAYFAQPLDFPPGTRANYSNSGYQMLGFLIHRITGKYYGDFFREHFFAPLGMTTTTVFSYVDVVPNRASGYEVVNGAWKNVWMWQSVSTLSNAEGSLLMSVLDLAKWDAALNTEHIVKQSSLETMWTPVPLDDGSGSAYLGGMGWYIASAHGHRIVFHTGGAFGFYAVMSRYLDDRLTIIIMTNIDESHADVLKIAGDIADIYLPETKGANPIKDWKD
jgi:CubicO group peptidase (beta-lactamase class C family)